MADYSVLTPVNILTGFLGSGKTSLLQRLLTSPQLTQVAVLVNEFGEIGLDHHLLQNVAESTLLLENGCVCCAIRGDLQQALRDLLSKRMRGDIANFRRVVIETSGLADPAPIAYTLLREPVIRHHYRLSTILTTVDALNGMAQLETFAEASKQAAIADRLILTKTDIADADRVQALAGHLRRLNPSALLLGSAELDVDSGRLLIDDIYDADGRPREIARWLAADDPGACDPSVQAPAHDHTHDIHCFSLTFEQPLDWSAFGIWSTMLLYRHGGDVLRIKALLNVAGVSTPVLINGVQHLVHPPSHLDAWPDGDRRSRLVFVVRGLSRSQIEGSLAAFIALVNPQHVVTA
jgi:G3E family GTPase